MGNAVRLMLCLSTSHVPGPDNPNFGSFRSVETEYGWIVWPYYTAEEHQVPEWFRPIFIKAKQEGCVCIEFDRDNWVDPEIKEYDW